MHIDTGARVADEIIAAYNRHDVEAVLSRYDPSAVIASPLHPEGAGVDGQRETLEWAFAAFGDLELRTEVVVSAADQLTTEFSLTATHDGPLQVPGAKTLDATGRRVAIRGVSHQEVDRAGMILSENTSWDVPALLDQLEVDLVAPLK